MKALGMIRPVDELGRITIPKEIRTNLDLAPGDGMEIFVEADAVILKKYAPSCVFCQNVEDVVLYKDKRICRKCLSELKQSN